MTEIYLINFFHSKNFLNPVTQKLFFLKVITKLNLINNY